MKTSGGSTKSFVAVARAGTTSSFAIVSGTSMLSINTAETSGDISVKNGKGIMSQVHFVIIFAAQTQLSFSSAKKDTLKSILHHLSKITMAKICRHPMH